MTAPLPVCVVGAGLVGMRHVEVAQASPKVHLTAVIETDPERRAALNQQGLPAVATLDDAPGDTRAAIIATPTPDHATSGFAALARGWAVLVEKPVDATLDAARALVHEARTKNLPLIVGHHRRCHPFSIAARTARAGIGELVGVQGLWSLRKNDAYFRPPWRRQAGSGPLMTNLSHEIDLLRFLVGDITEVIALTSSARRGFEIPDTAALSFRFENGALGSFLISDAGASPWSFEAASHENPHIAGSDQDYLRLTGTQGALAFPSLTQWGRSGPGEIEWGTPLRKNAPPAFETVDPLLVQIERFAALVGGDRDDILCTGPDGIAALEMTLATALSAQTGHPVTTGGVPGDYRGI